MATRSRLETGTDEPQIRFDSPEGEVETTVDFDTNELRDGGERCALCHAVIEPNAFVRRTAAGEWQHEACPWTRRRDGARKPVGVGGAR